MCILWKNESDLNFQDSNHKYLIRVEQTYSLLHPQAYENLGRLQHGRGNLAGAVEYLERGLSIAEQGPNSIEKFWLEF